MSWKFNPFTKKFYYFEEAIAPQDIGVSVPFIIADWVLSSGYYILDAQHNLDSLEVNNNIWENGADLVGVNRVSIINNNTIRLYVAVDPDCRFSGNVVIFKV